MYSTLTAPSESNLRGKSTASANRRVYAYSFTRSFGGAFAISTPSAKRVFGEASGPPLSGFKSL